MGWLRNLLVFPDDVWAAAAVELNAEFVQGKWLANSEIRLLHDNHPITLEVRFGEGDDNNQYTTAVPGVALDPKIELAMVPQWKGLLGVVTSGLAARTTIKIPALSEDYHVFGDDEKLANEIFGHRDLRSSRSSVIEIFGHRDLVSALAGLTQKPSLFVGSTLSVDLLGDEDADKFYVSVRGVSKEIHKLAALVDLNRVLLDVLDDNGCLTVAGS